MTSAAMNVYLKQVWFGVQMSTVISPALAILRPFAAVRLTGVGCIRITVDNLVGMMDTTAPVSMTKFILTAPQLSSNS